MRAGTYARVSQSGQHVENQLRELHDYCERRGWSVRDYVDDGISGTRDRRPSLDAMLNDARRRRLDVIVVWRLDRLGRNLRHLVMMLDELTALGVGLVSLGESLDTTTPAGRLQLHVLSAISQFERDRIAERVAAGLNRARAQGKRLGRPRKHPRAPGVQLTVRQAAALWSVSKSTAAVRLSRGKVPPGQTSPDSRSLSPLNTASESVIE